MILYFDSSAVVPLLIEEPSSHACQELWRTRSLVLTSRLTHVEVAAALASAVRHDRLTRSEFDSAVRQLDSWWRRVQIVEIDETLMRSAVSFAERLGLREYDAVHCASAALVREDSCVAVSGDRELLEAWKRIGLAVADTNDDWSSSL